ncbi:MAG TPA: HIRAN domain-containing protein [Thiobacillaceae bacterium]|nr:HIRAN domain-containing protein [Thiobacillaceae bacterium]HNU62985.1 HIRAN domain-containing protein [Thiobacillaceae bacterium]
MTADNSLLQWGLGSVLASLALHGGIVRAATETMQIFQTSPVAGFQYHAGPALFPLMRVGDPLRLIREPDNPHDPRAVGIYWRGAQIGYAPRLDNQDLARFMDKGHRLEGRILHLQRTRDPWKRVLMEIVIVEAAENP